MKRLRLSIATIIAAAALASCGKHNPEPQPQPVKPELHGLLIMNNGNWGSNDSGIVLYDTADKSVSEDVFISANSIHLGDLGQDIAMLGDDIFIAVNGSKIIFVTDRSLKIKTKVIAKDDKGNQLSPRCLAIHSDKVYVTYYEGWLGEIDPAMDYAVRLTAVGNSPEGVAYAGGSLYVANSGGALYPNYANTVSVVDPVSFREISRIPVNLNPQNIVANAEGTMLYINSFGNYGNVPAKLQCINLLNGTITDLDYSNVKSIVDGSDDKLYVVTGGYDAAWKICGSINVYDMKTGNKAGEFCKEKITDYYSISCTSDYVVVGASDYKTSGDVYLFGTDGKLIDRFDSQGLNPQKALYL